MFSLQLLTEKIAVRIAQPLQFDEDQTAVIAYGMFCFLQILASILLVILFGFFFHVLGEALIISLTMAILRKYSGGAHADTPGKCLVIGTVIAVVPAVLIVHIPVNRIGIILTAIPVFVWAFYAAFTKAPVDSAKKPITNKNKRKRLRSASVITVGVYGCIACFLLLLSYYFNGDSRPWLPYAACILFGTAWQTFTLTTLGNQLIRLLNTRLA